jgi:hypothetical protein
MDWLIFTLMLFVGILSQALTGWALHEGIHIMKTRIDKIIRFIGFYGFMLGIGWGLIYLSWTYLFMSFGGIFLSFIYIHRLIKHPATHIFCVLFQPIFDLIIIAFCLILWLVF